MANYGRTDLEERECSCGCGEKFKPKSPFRKYINRKHAMKHWWKLHPEKVYKSKRDKMKRCIEAFYNHHKTSKKKDPTLAEAMSLAEEILKPQSVD